MTTLGGIEDAYKFGTEITSLKAFVETGE